MLLADRQKAQSLTPRVVVEAKGLQVEQPYTHHWWWGDRSALWHEMRSAGMSRRAIHNTTVYLRESENPETEVHVRPRRRLFFHPIRFLDRKDAPKENQIIVNLGTKVTSSPAEVVDSTAHNKLEDGVYYLAHILQHRKLHNELKFPLSWGAVGLAANILLIQRFFPELHTSLTLYFLDSLHKGFSLPGLIETLPGLGVGFGSGYLVSRGLNVRHVHVHQYNQKERQFISDHQGSKLLQIVPQKK